MSYTASGGKILSAVATAGVLVTGYVLYGKKVDKLVAAESRKAVQAKRDFIEKLRKDQESI